MKRGQISVFIIISVIFILIVVVYFLIQKAELLNKKKINPFVEPIYSFVENCLKETEENAIIFISYRGGYYELPEISFKKEVPYYLYKGKNYMPLKKDIENAIGKYVKDNLNECINEFIYFKDFSISRGEIKSNVKIEDEKVIFNIDYPLNIKKNENSFNFRSFNFEIPVRLGIIYNSIENIMLNEIDEPEFNCISCIDYFAEENDLYIESINYNKNSILFSVIDKNSKLNNKVLIFNFINKYNWG